MKNYDTFKKAGCELLDYYAVYELEPNEEIIASMWLIPSATVDGNGNTHIVLDNSVTVDYEAGTPSYSLGGTSFSGNKTRIFLSGGQEDAEKILIENRITTEDSETGEQRIHSKRAYICITY